MLAKRDGALLALRPKPLPEAGVWGWVRLATTANGRKQAHQALQPCRYTVITVMSVITVISVISVITVINYSQKYYRYRLRKPALAQ